MTEKKKEVDNIRPKEEENAEGADKETKKVSQSPKEKSPFSSLVTNSKVPSRGTLWYIFFALSFIVLVAGLVYTREWAALFFVVVFGAATLWRGTKEMTTMELGIDGEGIIVNNKKFFFERIESFYFSRLGEDLAVNFQFVRKIYPKMTFTILEGDKAEKIREYLDEMIPETSPREEGYVDFMIRKLKL